MYCPPQGGFFLQGAGDWPAVPVNCPGWSLAFFIGGLK